MDHLGGYSNISSHWTVWIELSATHKWKSARKNPVMAQKSKDDNYKEGTWAIEVWRQELP